LRLGRAHIPRSRSAFLSCELLAARRIQEVWFEDNEPRRELLGIAAERLTRTLAECGYVVSRSSRRQPLPMDLVARRRDAGGK